jgi:hypothetical protein
MMILCLKFSKVNFLRLNKKYRTAFGITCSKLTILTFKERQIMSLQASEITNRKDQLRATAEAYFEALREKNFSAIPFDDNVSLRAPLCPGGVHHPLNGKDALRAQWWQPLEPALEGVEIKILDHYFNDSLTGIITEAEVTINAVNPPATLRVADRFNVNEQGKIIEQENHFDPRDVTNPGWQND